MHTAEKQRVISAIGDLGRRVTPADVATKTGLPVLVVQQELNKVASETGGHLQVGSTGDIVYTFAPGFSGAYLAKGLQAVFITVGSKIFGALYYLLRISFGIALVLSLVIVIVLLVAIAIAMMMRSGNDRDDRDGGFDLGGIFGGGHGGFHFSFWDWMILRDLLWWNSARSYQTVRYDYNRPTIRERDRSSFLLNCFSFLFGDGDPNEGLEEKRWQVIAQVIKRNGNVVTAEQLAPYTGANPKDEDAVLPVLVRFNGRPEVTSKGRIAYVFESLQTTAADQKVNPPAYLQEFPWKFSNVPGGELLPVYIVAGFNLAGAYVVWNFLHLPLTVVGENVSSDGLALLANALASGGLGWLANALLAYAIAFVTVPTVRAIINSFRNRGIDARNIQRFRYAQIVQHPDAELADKLVEVAQFRLRDKRMSEKDIVFTTEKDARDQDDDLSDKFKQMEADKKKESKKQDPPSGGATINVDPEAAEDDDGGRIINIKKKEFDASP